MEKYIWLFPVIFIFHDMEEIIGFGIWLKRNIEWLDKKYPFVSRTYKNFSTEGFALAVFEELVVCILICVMALITDNEYVYCLWLGGLIACTLHFAVHIGQSIIIKQYIPAVITSILCLPISIWIIVKCLTRLQGNGNQLFTFSMIGILIVALNLKFAQLLMGKFTVKMKSKLMSLYQEL